MYMPTPGTPQRPIFYDESNKRRSWLTRFLIVLFIAAGVLLTYFIVSIIALPLLPYNSLPRLEETKDYGNRNPVLTNRLLARRQLFLRREQRKLLRTIEKDRAALLRKLRYGVRPSLRPVAPQDLKPIVAGFYVNWDETSRASLIRNIDHITHFFPEWFHISKDGKGVLDARIPEDHELIEPFVRQHGVPILPVINNYIPKSPDSDQGAWSSNAIHSLISDPGNRAAFIAKLKTLLLADHFQGINIDFEMVPAADRDYLTLFMKQLYQAFLPSGLRVTQDVTIDDPAYDLPQLARWNDAIISMLYDEHSPGDGSGAGCIAGISWTKHQLNKMFSEVPPQKVILALGNYAYDWQKGDKSGGAVSLSYQSAVIQAKESKDPDDPSIANIKIDPKSLNPFYNYYDDRGKEHQVWMLDATTAYNQLRIARQWNPRGVALWYMGSEDPDIWKIIGRNHIVRDQGEEIDRGLIDPISYGRTTNQSEVDFEGEGELLEVEAQPTEGLRNITRDGKTGLIIQEKYIRIPSSFIVRRYGRKTKCVALTFDDGPSSEWTPKILDILKQKGVKATFFVVGAQAQLYPSIVAREWRDGIEIGNHSFTHPNFAITSNERDRLEINATQRIIETITGHSTTLFRPPYAIDVEPRTGEELHPIILASAMHFISVGEMDDPQDWNLWKKSANGQLIRKTPQDIIHDVWRDRNLGNIILLHDSGGDRSATVAALPVIIDMFKNAGYKFITLSELRGLPKSKMFPAVPPGELLLVRVDDFVFQSSYWFQIILITLFTLSVFLGVARQIWLACLALIRMRSEKTEETSYPSMADFAPMVSVIIAAYNEEKVIQRTINAILQSDYPRYEVIVVDDGSRDTTCEKVKEAFSKNPKVKLITKENGGKASALNAGIGIASGEIAVALDADTLFLPDTMWKLVRHFSDPKVGAVSGNVKVGNTNNILTKWQSLEYVTSQNFDRRAYDLLNCITVVPGAVGAWRIDAIKQAGGYSGDTLAEDTDLTWRIRRSGWRIANDVAAIGYTEAPESFSNLSKQRFRWAFGTLQNLWKHRDALFRYGSFGWIALPSLWVYQILFPAISPFMDIAVIWALLAGNFARVAIYYFFMIGLELVGAALAIWMDKGDWKLLPWLLLQRFVYRQMMYYVILKSLLKALSGSAVGWNKFERYGTAKLHAPWRKT
jgi:cellulose synthase/poly-beta-1,6-N-acetylglucosamine synthase-like glycosyltransferase/spore germination protein YaaH/peptidoglycan/xylan/chitin deacetylase (PgdA/CDA1 family)